MPDPILDLGAVSRSSTHSVDPKALSSPPTHGRRDVRHGRQVGWRSRDVVRTAGLVLAMYMALKLLWFANALFLVVFLGVLFAIAISAGVDRLERFRIPRGAGAALIVLSFFGVLFAFGAWLAPTLRSQGAELRQKLPEALERAEQWMTERQSGFFGILFGGGGGIMNRPSAAAPSQPTGATTTPVGGAAVPAGQKSPPAAPSDSQSASASRIHERIQEKLSGAARYLFPFLTHTAEAFAGFLIVVFLSIYLAADPALYRRGMLALLPDRRRAQGAYVMDRITVVLRKWLVTQLIAMLTIGVVTTIVLLLLRVKAAFALGLLAGLFEFIPTFGPLLSAVPGVAMGFLDSPEKAASVALAYWGIQFLENHVLIPLLMKGGMDLPPALTVITQALLALVFGFLGLMVAVPMLATVMVLVQVLYVDQLAARKASADGEGTGRRPGLDPDLDEALERGVATP
ncbi:MAG TPA: AI-2E family transporter [Gemmatimonadaceae bacterium]